MICELCGNDFDYPRKIRICPECRKELNSKSLGLYFRRRNIDGGRPSGEIYEKTDEELEELKKKYSKPGALYDGTDAIAQALTREIFNESNITKRTDSGIPECKLCGP